MACRLYLGAGALATGGYYLLSDGAGAVLNVVVGASAVAAIAAGIRWHRPSRRAAWLLIAAAQGQFVAGDALFSVNELDALGDQVRLCIRDDGVGFDLPSAA